MQSQYKSQQVTLYWQTVSKVYMESPKTQVSQHKIEGDQSLKTDTTQLQD